MKLSKNLAALAFHASLICPSAFPFYIKSTGMGNLFLEVREALKGTV